MAKQREKKHLKNWLRSAREAGMITYRMQDLSYATGMSNKRPFDGYLFYEALFFPFEAKYQDGGKTWSVRAWKQGKQKHQYTNLLKYSKQKALSFLIIFWKIKGKISPRIARVEWLADVDKLVLEDLPVGDSLRTFMEVFLPPESPGGSSDRPLISPVGGGIFLRSIK